MIDQAGIHDDNETSEVTLVVFDDYIEIVRFFTSTAITTMTQ